MRLLVISLFITFFTSLKSYAEYRMYELKIENIEKGTERTVQSTMDHLQYPRYYPLNKDEVINYVDSWMCFENMSNFRPPCPKPNLE